MKLKALIKRYMFAITGLLFVTACSQEADYSARKTKFDQSWKFYHGEMEGAEKESYDDSNWRILDIPHDWSVEPLAQSDSMSIGPFFKGSIGGFAMLRKLL